MTVRFHALPDNVKGSLTILVAAALFAAMTAVIKLVGQRLDVTQILLVRQAVMTAIVAPGIVAHFPGSLKTTRPGLQVIRVALALVAMLLGFTAVIQLPLADATALGFAKSFFVTIFAVWFLHETVGWRRWVAVGVGFLGVVVMVRPGTEGFDPIALLAIIAAAAAGLVMIVIRILTRTESAITILSYQAILVGICMIVPAWFAWLSPTPAEWAMLIGVGVLGYCAQILNIHAYKWGEASVLASLDYLRLLYATLFGWLLFDSLPTVWTAIGAAVIICASLYTVQRERQVAANLARSPEGRGLTNH